MRTITLRTMGIRNHVLIFQTLTAPNGLLFDAFGAVEGRRHYFSLYAQSFVEADQILLCTADIEQHYVHVYSGYNRTDLVDVLFQCLNLSNSARAVNTSTASFRDTVEFSYMEVNIY